MNLTSFSSVRESICTRGKRIDDSVLWQKPLHPQKNPKRQSDNTKKATNDFYITTIADRLKMVSWCNNSHPTGVIKQVYEWSTLNLYHLSIKIQCSLFIFQPQVMSHCQRLVKPMQMETSFQRQSQPRRQNSNLSNTGVSAHSSVQSNSCQKGSEKVPKLWTWS